ncbi:MAG: ribosome hibernation-promoting factor, HPF/YfiA family [Bacteroidia bacterium]
MKPTLHGSQTLITESTRTYVEEKMQKLFESFNFIVHMDVYLREVNPNTSQSKEITLRVQVPGETLVSTDVGSTYQEAFDKALDTLKRQLKKYKELTMS